MPRVKRFDEKEALGRAMEVFWTKGYHATSVQDLVDALGINRSSLYDTFGGKRQLFDRAFQAYRQTNLRAMRAFLREQPSVREGFQRLFASAIDASLADPDRKGCFVVNVTTELIPGKEDLQAVLLENKQAFEALFQEFLERGERLGEFPPGKDLGAIASLLFTLYNGLQVVAKVESDPRKLQATVAAALGVLD